MIRLKRAYDPPSPEDGHRVLVDRLWPRGKTKEALQLERWAKELAPSAELRQDWCHDAERFPEFTTRYRAELKALKPELEALAALARKGTLTLVYGAKDPEINHARVLEAVLLELLKQG